MHAIADLAKFADLLRRLWRHRFTQPGLLVLAMAGLWLSYWSQYSQFPYYWAWDLDHIQVADLLVIQSGFLPDNISHTAFGMNLLFSLASRVAYDVGIVSAIDLEAVRNFVNPALAVGQLLVFLRALSPFAALIAVAGACWALRPVYRGNAAALPGALLALGLMPWTAYHVTMIRVELYSVMYWALGTGLLFALSTHPSTQAVRYLLAGLCMGLAYLTKVQSVPLIGLSCLLALAWRWDRALEEPRELYPPLLSHGRRIDAAGAVFIALGLLAAWAYVRPWPPNYAGNVVGLEGVTLVFAVLSVCVLAAVALAVASRWIASRALQHLDDCMLLLLGGVVIALASHVLLPMPFLTAVDYLLADLKVALFLIPRVTQDDVIAQTIEVWGEFWPLIGVSSALVLGLAWKLVKEHSRRAVPLIVLLVLSLLVAVAGAGLMTRPYLRDFAWSELAFGFPILIVGGMFAGRLRNGSMRALVLLFAIGSVLIYDAYGRIDFQGKLDANYNLYGWRRDMLFGYRYGENQRHYIDAISGWSSTLRDLNARETLLVTRQTEDIDRIRRTLGFVLWNVPLQTQRIGVVVSGGRVTHETPELYFGKITPEGVGREMEGAILYDLSQVQPSSRRLPRRETVVEMMETDKKITMPGNPGVVALLGRRDLSIWLFLPNDSCNWEAERESGAPADAQLVLHDAGGGATQYLGYPLRGYATIPTSCFRRPGFLVVREW